jgi:hypothetical protein
MARNMEKLFFQMASNCRRASDSNKTPQNRSKQDLPRGQDEDLRRLLGCNRGPNLEKAGFKIPNSRPWQDFRIAL